MLPLLTEYFILWLILGGLILLAGLFFFSQTGSLKMLLISSGIAILAWGVGSYFVFFFPTERKEIKRTIYALADAVEKNDWDSVRRYLDPSAKKTIARADYHLKLAKISKARAGKLKIQNVNHFTSPPTALVSLNALVQGETGAFLGSSPFTILVRFDEVELVKGEGNLWRVTDRCVFKYPGYHGD